MTARDKAKDSDLNRGPKRTPPKQFRPEPYKKPPQVVSDHAVLRYMERVLGLDVEVIRNTMLTASQVEVAKRMREGELPIGGGHYARIVNGRVATIL
jgi:hypothetical protein